MDWVNILTAGSQGFIAVIVIAILTTLGGLWIASKRPSWYNQERLSLFIAVGTGMLLSVAFIEFLPHALHSSIPENHTGHSPHLEIEPFLILLGIFLIVFMEVVIAPKLRFLDEKFNHGYNSCHEDHGQTYGKAHHEAHHHHEPASHTHHIISHQAACSALGCLLVCAFFDGLQLKTAFLLGANTGWATSIGLFFHTLPDGVLAASIALAGGLSARSAKLITVLTGATLLIGAFSSFFLEQVVIGKSYVLALSTGVLLYVSLMHLLPVGLKNRHGLFWLFLGMTSMSLIFHFSH